MLIATHSVFGVFLTLIILALFGIQWSLHWTIIFFAILGSIIPDIDHPHSVIGKMFYFISVPLERKYGHRTVTHSLVGWVIFTTIFGFLILFVIWILSFICNLEIGYWNLAPRWLAAFSISYFSHLVLDMFNKRGSQMFWPDTGRDIIPRNPDYRIDSGSKVEFIIFFIFLGLLLLAFPLSKFGLGSSLRWLLATPASAIEEYKSLKEHAYLDFQGVFRETKEPVKGKAEILDVDNKRLVILLKDVGHRTSDIGQIYTLSDELAADIFASHVRVKRTKTPIIIDRKEFKDKTREYLLSQIPKGALVSGLVHLPESMIVKIPASNSFYKVIEQKGNDLILNYATRGQIVKLALGESFEIEQRKDQAELLKLEVEAGKIKAQIKELKNGGDLTPLGKELFLTKEEAKKQILKLAELKSRLEDVNIKIDEANLKIKNKKQVFSGEVYIRQ